MKRWLIPLVLVFAGLAPAAAQPSMVSLPLVPGWAKPSARVSSVDPNESVSIEIVLPWRDPQAVAKRAAQISNPRSPFYQRYMTSSAFRSRYAPSDETVSIVVAWLRAGGLEVGRIPANRIVIPARGAAAKLERMFNVTLSRYRVGAFSLRAPDSAPSVPSSIASLGALVRGLDESSSLITTGGPLTADMLQTASPPPNVPETPASPADTAPPGAAQYAAPCSSYDGQKILKQTPSVYGAHQPAVTCSMSPETLREAYAHDAVHHALRTHDVDGSGQTIVMIGSHEIRSLPSDLTTWSARNNIPALKDGQFHQLSYPGAYQTPNDPVGIVLRPSVWAQQASMLFETMRAIAPGAQYLYVGSTSSLDLQDAMLLAVDQHFGDVIVNGWYSADEAGILPSDMAPIDEAGQQAATTGISLLFASGDIGDNAHFNATDTYGIQGSTAPVKDVVVVPGHPSVSFPADNSMVTAVGATSLIAGRRGSYQRELCWAKSFRPISSDKKRWLDPVNANYRGSGGGRSLLYDQPQYQQGVVPDELALRDDGTLGRTVPDVSVNGDAETGMLIGYTMTFPDKSVRYAERRINADTAATGLFAAVIALANQNDDVPLGFVNPLLYLMSANGYRNGTFHDITALGRSKTGIRTEYVNGVDSGKGITRTLKTFEQFGTNIPREGYDTCSGIGSVGPGFLRDVEQHVAGTL